MIMPSALRGLENDDSSVRLKVALAVGTSPDPAFVGGLVERSAVEPDFYVRDMLTWALTRHPVELTVPRLIEQLRSERPRARSQALHTLSKVGDPRAWPAITRELLTDADDEVARTAWRTAAALAPEDERTALAGVLTSQLGRGGRDTRLSLSQALIAIGEEARPVLRDATLRGEPAAREHAIATEQLWRDPDAGFEPAVEEAKRVVALGPDWQAE